MGWGVWLVPTLKEGQRRLQAGRSVAGEICSCCTCCLLPLASQPGAPPPTQVAINGERPWIDPDCPEPLRRLITKCWHQDPHVRAVLLGGRTVGVLEGMWFGLGAR